MPSFERAESSAVSHVRYDARRRRLHVTFRDSGERYVYLEVPASVYDALMTTDSKGRFINEEIRDRYRFVHLKLAS